MKIISRAEFLKLPEGTLYSKYEPQIFGDLEIKGETRNNDFWSQQIADAIDSQDSGERCDLLIAAEKEGENLTLDFHCEHRDGLFDENQLFAVWDPSDVEKLIARLQEALRDSK